MSRTERSKKSSVTDGTHYIVQMKKRGVSKHSASGGAFAGIALSVLNELGGVVFGAAMCSDNTVRHIIIESDHDLIKLQNFIYVQSNIGETYILAKEQLVANNRYVLFSGTPCQIAGLYMYLGKVYDKLIIVDIICHGVPSPKLFYEHNRYYSKSRQGSIKNLTFRYKNKLFKSGSSFCITMTI